jgi:hypothetical protein
VEKVKGEIYPKWGRDANKEKELAKNSRNFAPLPLPWCIVFPSLLQQWLQQPFFLAAFRRLFSFPRRKQLNYSKVAVTFENGSYCGEDRIEFSLLFFNL